MFQQHLTSRLMQRYAVSATPEDLEHCAWLLAKAPNGEVRRELMIGMNRAFQGRSLPPLPEALSSALEDYQSTLGDSGLILGVRQGGNESIEQSLQLLKDRSGDVGLQLEIVKVLGEVKVPQAVSTLLSLATGRATAEPALQRVAIKSLSQYDEDSIPTALVSAFGSRISAEHGLRSTACRTLATRPHWAKVLLEEINAWRVRPEHVPPDVVQQLRTYEDPELLAAVERAFGKTIDSAPEKLAEANRLRDVLTQGQGDADLGKQLFANKCGNCHQLFGEGKKVGPPLDGYERGNLNFWLNAIVDPSLEIREGFQSYQILTTDGRSLNGMIAAQDDATVTLRNAENQLTVVSRDEIDLLRALPTSLMPADVLRDMNDQQLRDLFTYLSLGTKK
jgi:putative heme-binding domain-containing protein